MKTGMWCLEDKECEEYFEQDQFDRDVADAVYEETSTWEEPEETTEKPTS